MCGVFGFVSYDGKGPNIQRLAKIAAVTMRRGPHAFGFAWLDFDGRLRMFKRTGRIVDHLGLLAMAKRARILVGHCRFATHGSPKNNGNNHPHPADGGWLVHNGQVGNHEELAAEYDLWPTSECDSEVLGLMIAGTRGGLQKRVATTAAAVRGDLAMLGVWKPGRMMAVRRGKPLHVGESRDGRRFYLGSLPQALPGTVEAVPDGSGIEFSPTALIRFDVTGEPVGLTK
jgi:glucosamine--fructose-6-phosphate aminotransferase (isomerizing)